MSTNDHDMLVPKTLGADIELGNSLSGSRRHRNIDAARCVLRQVPRLRLCRQFVQHGSWTGDGTDRGRHWLPNGSCMYIDMEHVELCPQETGSARSHAAAVHAIYWIAGTCARRAQRELDDDEELFVNVHNSDCTRETSWGAHLNVLVSRRLWDDLFHHKPHLMALLASFLSAAVPVFGQGLVYPIDGGRCRYLTSARTPHTGQLVALPTTEPFNRPLVNSRDEPHAGSHLARLHLIPFDANLQPANIMMRSGLVQLVLAALECGWYDPGLLLDDPLEAVRVWSWSFCPGTGSLRPPRLRRPGGRGIGLWHWHQRLLAGLYRLVQSGRIPEHIVPEGKEILDLWAETLDDLMREDLEALSSRLDWALKWRILSRIASCTGDLEDPRLRLLDQLYGNVDRTTGLFWTFWRNGLVERVVDTRMIGRFLTVGDPSTRSALRGYLVARLRPWIAGIDWGYVELSRGNADWWAGTRRYRLELPDPSDPGPFDLAELSRRLPEDEDLLEFLIDLFSQDRRRLPDAAESSSSSNLPAIPNQNGRHKDDHGTFSNA